MAEKSYGWRREASLEEWLAAEPWEFEFFQAVKLLERMQPLRPAPGAGLDPEDESIRFRSRVELAFQASEVHDVDLSSSDGPATLTTNLFSLAGSSGPLPFTDTELILEREWRKDHGMLEFLDMFHHRLLSLLVKVRKAHRPSLHGPHPADGPLAQYLFACFGLGLPQLRNRLELPDRCLLFYANILAHHPRSASGLERLISDYFQVSATVDQLEGEWNPLEPEDWTRLGTTGQNQTLGGGATLGTRVWDQQGRFSLTIGPLRYAQFKDFLPIGAAYRATCALTRFYAGPDSGFALHLRLQTNDVRESRLAGRDQPGQTWLGWTSWLKTGSSVEEPAPVRLSSRWHLSAARPAEGGS